MSDRPAAQIDLYTIERTTDNAKAAVEHYVDRALELRFDPRKSERLPKQECVVCFYTSRVAGAACSQRPCALCGIKLYSGSTHVHTLCIPCAKLNSLCCDCGGDIDLKLRRRKAINQPTTVYVEPVNQ